jgi:hypothetical protein
MIIQLFIIFFILSLLALTMPIRFCNKYLFTFFWILLILTSAFRGDVDRDYGGYIDMLQRTYTFVVEPTFVFFSKIINNFLGGKYIFIFIFYALLGVSIKMYAIKKLTNLKFFSLLIYFCGFFILQEMTQIRVGVAAGFMLISIIFLEKRNLSFFLLSSLFAFLFHYSAIIIFPLWFIYKINKPILFLLIPVSYFVYFIDINLIYNLPIPGVNDKISMYQIIADEKVEVVKTNVFNYILLLNIILYYIFLSNYNLLKNKNKYFPILIRIYLISISTYILFAKMPIFSTRVSEIYGVVQIIIIPFLFYIFKMKLIPKALIVIISSVFIYTAIIYSKLII